MHVMLYSMISFEQVFFILIIFVLIHLSLSIYLLSKIRNKYPNTWKFLGSPKFITLEGAPDSAFNLNVVKFLFTDKWGDDINDKNLLLFRSIVRVTAVIGVVLFIFLIVLGFIQNKFQGG